MNTGKKFEQQWKNSIDRNTTYFFRIQDSPNMFSPNMDSKNIIRFTLKNPYDCFCFYKYRFFATELKSKTTQSFSFQRDGEKNKSKDIKRHPIEGLAEAAKYDGVFAGFVFNFNNEKNPCTYFLHIQDFLRFESETDKKSISYQDIIHYGGILIEQTLKKVNYHYNVSKFFDYLIEKERR